MTYHTTLSRSNNFYIYSITIPSFVRSTASFFEPIKFSAYSSKKLFIGSKKGAAERTNEGILF